MTSPRANWNLFGAIFWAGMFSLIGEGVKTIHDREIRLDNGWVIKIGRGLDIYQRPESWRSLSAADYSLRACKETKVDVFMRAK